uniref:Gag protein n=1 Tax=Romanomermis culicivorax TaxID=13658 RepID=A0A915L1R6_ROMCU
MMFEQPTPQPVAFYQFGTCKQCRDESTSEFLSRLRTLQADSKYENFNAGTDLAYTLAQNCYLQYTQKWLFLWHAVTLDVYVNMVQAAESAERSSTTIPGGWKDVHAIHNNSHRDSDRYPNGGRDQSPNRSKHLQSPRGSKHCPCCGSTHHTYLSPDCKAKDSKYLEHRIMLMDNAIPIARPVRQVPIAHRAAVEKEVEQMVIDDIWE